MPAFSDESDLSSMSVSSMALFKATFSCFNSSIFSSADYFRVLSSGTLLVRTEASEIRLWIWV